MARPEQPFEGPQLSIYLVCRQGREWKVEKVLTNPAQIRINHKYVTKDCRTLGRRCQRHDAETARYLAPPTGIDKEIFWNFGLHPLTLNRTIPTRIPHRAILVDLIPVDVA